MQQWECQTLIYMIRQNRIFALSTDFYRPTYIQNMYLSCASIAACRTVAQREIRVDHPYTKKNRQPEFPNFPWSYRSAARVSNMLSCLLIRQREYSLSVSLPEVWICESQFLWLYMKYLCLSTCFQCDGPKFESLTSFLVTKYKLRMLGTTLMRSF